MKIAVLGTGEVGRTLASKLVQVGHQVRLGSRTPNNETANAWATEHGEAASSGTFANAAEFAELIVNATPGEHSLAVLRGASPHLEGKIIVDVANPLDFSKGMPPTLSVSNTSSLAEAIQSEFGGARVVKALNTMWNGLMVNPRMLEGTHHTFICGNDEPAKEVVAGLLRSFGWAAEEIIDLGDLIAARGTEMWLPLWLRIFGATGNGAFNMRLVFADRPSGA